MADNAGSSSTSSNVSSRYSSDTEMMVKPKRPRISKDSKVSARRKNKMKFQKTKRRHCKNHRYNSSYNDHSHKKPTNGRGDPYSTRKRRHSPSSSSSGTSSENSDVSTDTDTPTSDENCSGQCSSGKVPKESKPSAKRKRKKAKLSPTESKTSTRNSKLRAVFKNHFSDLLILITDPELLAAQLYSESLISSATLDEIMTLPISRLKKTLRLLLDLKRKIQVYPEKLFVFIHVMERDSSLEDIVKQMLGEAPLEKEDSESGFSLTDRHHSQLPKHTSNTEIRTIHAAKQSDSSNQEQEKVSCSDQASVPHQLSPLSSTIAKYQHYLKSVYEVRSTLLDDKLLIGPSAQYINLAITKKKQFSHMTPDHFTRPAFYGGVDQILHLSNPMDLADLFVPDNESPIKCILVEGPPGIGKSTFAQQLCRKWNELEIMKKYLLVMLFKLRQKHVQNAKYLYELFSYPTDPTMSQAIVNEISQGENVLLILDGLDEFPSPLLQDDNCLIKQIIAGVCLPKATVVVTSRPSARVLFMMCQPQVSKHIEIIGFTEESRVKYAQSALSSQPDMLVHFLKHTCSNPIIDAMMHVPLNCAIVVQIYKECEGARKLIPRTMTQLYTALCRSLLRRFLVENSLVNSDYRMPQNLNDLPQDVCKHLRTVSEIAFYGIKQQKLVFYKHELPEGFQHMGFMNECTELYVDRGVESSYNFLHLSLQEYLAACYIALLPDTEQKCLFLLSLSSWNMSVRKDMSMVRRFLAGITGFKSQVWRNILSQHMLQHRKHKLTISNPGVCVCLFEAQNYKLCRQCLRAKIVNFKLTDGLVSSTDFYAVGYCITHSTGAWRITASSCSGSGTEALEMLAKGIKIDQKHQKQIGSIQSLSLDYIDICTGVSWLKELPQSTLSQLSNLSLPECRLCPKSCEFLAQAISMMPNLHSLDISSNPHIGLGGAVPLIESLCSLKHLRCLKIHDTNCGCPDAKVLTKLIKTSRTLQCLSIGNLDIALTFQPQRLLYSLYADTSILKISSSALAVGTLKEIELCATMADMIQFSCIFSPNSTITTLKLRGEPQRCCDGLAYLSQALYTNTSLTSLSESFIFIGHDPTKVSKFSKEEVITLLNDALCHNSHLRNLELDLFSLCLNDTYGLQRLERQLRRGPSVPKLKLKRARSISCLNECQSPVRKEIAKRNVQLYKSPSAPDLTLTRTISSLHPAFFNFCLMPFKTLCKKK